MTEMKKILLSTVLILAFAASSYAVPVKTAMEVGDLDYPSRQDVCALAYYNVCSGWIWYWTGWTPGAQLGTCFDLTDCADCSEPCHDLAEIVWLPYPITTYGHVDVEVFCGDDVCCPIGDPLGGWYNFPIDQDWANRYHFVFSPPLDVSGCDPTMIVMVTLLEPDLTAPVSSSDQLNWHPPDGSDPCATEWTCEPHSYIYRDALDYCFEYGAPVGWIVTGYPESDCEDHGGPADAFYVNLFLYIYLGCEGATATEDATWSEIKALYK
jgi:hypothetical protein